MIVPMKRVAVITQSKDADLAVKALRSLGIVHVEHEKHPKGKDILSLNEDLILINAAISVLGRQGPSNQTRSESAESLSDWKFTARHIVDLEKRLEQLDEFANTLRHRISQWEIWGDFDPQAIKALEDKNIYVRLYQIPVKDVKNLPAGVIVKKLHVAGGIAYCAVILHGKVDIPFKEIAPPKTGLKDMSDRLSEDLKVMDSIRGEVRKAMRYCETFIRIKRKLENELEFYEALNGMGSSGNLVYLTGYIPHDQVESIIRAAKRERWGMFVRDPSGEDKVPTLIRNPRWISLIAPLFKVLEIVPGYRELDISLWFLVFFSIFFGMLIGDAGYGFIYLILTFLFQRKLKARLRDKSVFALFYILSCAAVLWGLLSGTIFGQEWIRAFFKPLLPALSSSKNIEILCFFLGTLHLSIAHLWRAVLKAPSLSALADIGWTLILWGAFFLARVLVLGDIFPPFAKWFFIVGPLFVLFFTNPSKNILKGIGGGLSSLLLNFVNTFTDVVSYIRLFAVGLAGVAVADAFNKMAMDVGFNSVLTGILTSLILLLGHLLNILLGPMAVLVHGVRLNVLEFCSHVDVKWSGFPYKPLSEKISGK